MKLFAEGEFLKVYGLKTERRRPLNHLVVVDDSANLRSRLSGDQDSFLRGGWVTCNRLADRISVELHELRVVMRVVATEVGRDEEAVGVNIGKGVMDDSIAGDTKEGERLIGPGRGGGRGDEVVPAKPTRLSDKDLGQGIHHPVKEAGVATRGKGDELLNLAKGAEVAVIFTEPRLEEPLFSEEVGVLFDDRRAFVGKDIRFVAPQGRVRNFEHPEWEIAVHVDAELVVESRHRAEGRGGVRLEGLKWQLRMLRISVWRGIRVGQGGAIGLRAHRV